MECASDLYKTAKRYRATAEEKEAALQGLFTMNTKEAREYLFKLANDGYVQEEVRQEALTLAIAMGKYLDGERDLPVEKRK